jgi:hypothetical protein
LGLTFNSLFSPAAKVAACRFNQIYYINHLSAKAKIIFRCLSGIRTDPSGVLRELGIERLLFPGPRSWQHEAAGLTWS